ncbi:hypothetical protein PUNSTDRAFT_54946 [Punctularia strigosozonata HHB-11173 SS5]|uniref:uncharacterized protein n=1 Tax=Punctularia strigosozonata (strain HHB-11173) TaxID=741275 RepID=UPI000441818F|nr:uncharacterized protein PUNSTDRAFT_54946 [Punctularia strigosozonata HHB-11173 SS5]EIN05583.1 hypothetical protein PUNSTDRAFT_54946 [Punctularia strigosozonata HHB-11173 SS5]
MLYPLLASVIVAALASSSHGHRIDRKAIVSRYNPKRNASNLVTPMQVGNGDFAFGADVTSLQTFQPYAVMSSWGWKNDSLPIGRTMQDVMNYRGVSWWNHDLLVEYMFGGEAEIQQWLISNPNRANLGRTGLVFFSSNGSVVPVVETELVNIQQELDLWTGTLTSHFTYDGQHINVQVNAHQDTGAVGVQITSPLLHSGRLGLFLDYPWNDGSSKFSAPFVGIFNATANHTTSLTTGRDLGTNVAAQITHAFAANTFFTSLGGDRFSVSRDSPTAHRYTIRSAANSSTFAFTLHYDVAEPRSIPTAAEIVQSSNAAWENFWEKSGFVDVYSGSTDSRADELQRRIVLSRYLLRVNEAGGDPPQESGLVNNGWYGKFHLEMFFWHEVHWALWGNWDLLKRATPVYQRFLPTSVERAQVQQPWSAGARWGKMSDPSGRSAPGEINELLIWQQVHPLVFAEYQYRAFPNRSTLKEWRDVVVATADWMAAFAWWNQTTKVYDLGPPMYVVSEDTSPNVTVNPAFELAYWRFGLGLAETWMKRLGEKPPAAWSTVKANLAPLPIENGLYAVYEGIEHDFWADPAYTNDHPALVGLHGWLPPTPGLNLTTAKATIEQVWTTWNITNSYGWDFPMLAMSAARNNESEQAIGFLLNELFSFDDAGYPTGGVRVPTPYFPSSGSFLLAIAQMAAGWDGSDGVAPGFPATGWHVRVEGIAKTL